MVIFVSVRKTVTSKLNNPGIEPPATEDKKETEATTALEQFFSENANRVFYSKQVEVLHENDWFHWITNRALRDLVEDGVIHRDVRELKTGATIHLMWHRTYRYYKRGAQALVNLVDEFADPTVGAALGDRGEGLVLEGFARTRFLMAGRNTQTYADSQWTKTGHDLDLIFERDGEAYGIEVKNTLGYMPKEELDTKIELCIDIGVRPVFAARMLPRSWINQIIQAGGYAMIMKFQMYPPLLRDLARRVADETGMPVDSPRALQDGTMQRFVNWHEKVL